MNIVDLNARDAAAITPSDAANLPKMAIALFIGTAGNLSCVTEGGSTILFTGLLAGSFLNLRVVKVNATLTTCTNMVALLS